MSYENKTPKDQWTIKEWTEYYTDFAERNPHLRVGEPIDFPQKPVEKPPVIPAKMSSIFYD